MLRGTKSHGQDPVGDGAVDDGPGHDTALGSMLAFGRGPSGSLVDEVVDVGGLGDPSPVFEDMRLERHVGKQVVM